MDSRSMAAPICAPGPSPPRPMQAVQYAPRDLVKDGKIHSAMYTDPGIFDLEMERIFHRTWLFIGHESEVAQPGEFKLRRMGRQPVIMVRGKSGEVNVFLNRCRHRGAMVAEVECGKTTFFKCWWHGWIYDSDGKLVEVPRDDAYRPGFQDEIGGLIRPPHVTNYRGFVFAALGQDVLPLGAHMGRALDMLDYLADASPEGRVAVDSGVSKTAFNGNWKFVGMDGYHVDTVHASVLAVWEQKANSGLGATHRGGASGKKSPAVTRAFGHGNVMIDYRVQRLGQAAGYLDFLRTIPGGQDYISRMIAKHGETRGLELLTMAGDPHIGIYPNLQVINNQIRIINPLAADKTQVLMLPVLLDGVSTELNQARLRQHESFYGAAGAGSPDDNEMFERAQRGMQATVEPWLDISRGLHREQVDPQDGSVFGAVADEVPQRDQVREWVRLMTADV